MCGINGYIALHNQNEQKVKGLLSKMNDLIFHRGPDEDGFFARIQHPQPWVWL